MPGSILVSVFWRSGVGSSSLDLASIDVLGPFRTFGRSFWGEAAFPKAVAQTIDGGTWWLPEGL